MEGGEYRCNEGIRNVDEAALWVSRQARHTIWRKLEVDHGDWEKAVAKNSPFALRTVQKFMQMAEGALLNNGFEADERSFRALTTKRSKLDEFGKLLKDKLDESLKGKSKKQLEIDFGIRNPRETKRQAGRKALANPSDLDDAENRQKTALQAAYDLQDAAARLIEAGAFNPTLRNIAAWASYDVLRATLPDTKFLTQPPARP